MRGMGQVSTALLALPNNATVTAATGPSLANPYPGTFSDVNCPWWCWLLGNGIDSAVSAQCTPCNSTCPLGQLWDTTNLTCSADPVTTNAAVGSNDSPATDYTPWLIAGAVVLGIVALKMVMK